MLRHKILKDKKGEVGETITWVVATLIVVGIMIIFIVLSVLMSRVKTIAMGDIKTDLSKESKSLDLKTSLANQITNNKNKEIIDSILKEDGK